MSGYFESVSERLFSSGKAVPRTPEFDRIYQLPRRSWEADAPRLVDGLTRYLRAPGGQQKLRDIQAVALRDLHDFKGLFGPIRAGGGKTLLTMLAPVVAEKKRPVLLLPAKLIDKTRREMNALRKHWLIPGYIRIISYEMLGRQQAAGLLVEASPDLIIMDEAHKVKNPKAAVTKRVKRYLEANPHCQVVAMSGTVTKRSLLDYAHIAEWCLPRTNPTPSTWDDKMMWSYVLDERKEDMYERFHPGALMHLCNAEEQALAATDLQTAVRRAFRRRLVETPGVVASQEGALGTSLRIDSVTLDMTADWIGAIKDLRTRWVRPDGEDCIDAIELWRHLRELACGFFYRWDPTPPPEWREARKAWTKYVREVLRNNRSGIDSESQVVSAIERGGYDREVLDHWRAIKPSYTPKTQPVWLSYAVLDYCVQWASEKGEDGGPKKPIIWVEHTEFGKLLSERSGLPFYWRQGQDARGRVIEDHPPGTPMIASIASNSEGRNLQAWSDNLVVSWPPTGSMCEQLLARTHRDGQEADEVNCTVMMNIRELASVFEKTCRDAKYITETLGQEQRLSYADISCITSEDIRFAAR